jgi:nucleoside-diphosphate-sugar epimerase
VAKIVYTSTVGVFGNTHGQVVDETYKATRELGWQPRPLEQTFKEVLDSKLARRKN